MTNQSTTNQTTRYQDSREPVLENQRVHVASVYDRVREYSTTGGDVTRKGELGKNIAFSFSNDEVPARHAKASPMLVYQPYQTEQGAEGVSYTAGYTEEEWQHIVDVGNKDGDSLVIMADLVPNQEGYGYRVDTSTMTRPDVPFNLERHVEQTLKARESGRTQRVSGHQTYQEVHDDFTSSPDGLGHQEAKPSPSSQADGLSL